MVKGVKKMNSDVLYDRLSQLFSKRGFNLVRKIKAEVYDQLAQHNRRISNIIPDASSLILVGFAGKEFWETLKNFLQEYPSFKNAKDHWIDEYTILCFDHARRILDDHESKYSLVFPFGHEGAVLDFTKLGELGGVGVKSLLGILINPEYGSWISLRGAILTDMEFMDYDKPLSWFDPCPSCSKPCISACPAGTISENGWDYNACMKFRIGEDTCKSNCASRRACPYGNEHQYSEEQLSYHHKFVLESTKKHFS